MAPLIRGSRSGNGHCHPKLAASAFAFVKELEGFSYELSGLDHVWDVLFPDKAERWDHLHINKYENTFYITHVCNGDGLEVKPGKAVRPADSMSSSSSQAGDLDQLEAGWEPLLTSARRWLRVARKDWIGANRRVQLEYPLRNRYGVIPHALVRASLLDAYRLDEELGKRKTLKLVRLVEDGFFLKDENTVVSSMTAADYFRYCRIAYIAGRRKGEMVDASLSGSEMYRRYADGRHEGLLDIDPDSEQEFADWIDGAHSKRVAGGHPWEIKRGGNTTHIDLVASRPSPYRHDGFRIELQGDSIGRMAETMRMFLAIHKAGLPISIADPEGVRKRLLALDKIGIIPSFASLHGANRHFSPDQDVFDVMSYDAMGRYKLRAGPFVTWEPLPLLKPRGT